MCGSNLQNAFSIGWNKTQQSASYCIEINPMPVKSQMVVNAFAIWSLVYFDGIFLLIKINMEKRRISNAFHECINLRLTSLSVATLAHIYKVVWWNYASSMKYAQHTHLKCRTHNIHTQCKLMAKIYPYIVLNWYGICSVAMRVTNFISKFVFMPIFLSHAFLALKLYRHMTWRHITQIHLLVVR